MKKYLVAASIALGAIVSGYSAAHAQAVIITDGDAPDYRHRHHDFRDEDRYDNRHDDRGWHRGWDRPRFQHARCMTRMETVHRHGHIITRETRVCR